MPYCTLTEKEIMEMPLRSLAGLEVNAKKFNNEGFERYKELSPKFDKVANELRSYSKIPFNLSLVFRVENGRATHEGLSFSYSFLLATEDFMYPLMAHETGHLALGHTRSPSMSFSQQRQREIDADSYCVKFMVEKDYPIDMMLKLMATMPLNPKHAHLPNKTRAISNLRHYNKLILERNPNAKQEAEEALRAAKAAKNIATRRSETLEARAISLIKSAKEDLEALTDDDEDVLTLKAPVLTKSYRGVKAGKVLDKKTHAGESDLKTTTISTTSALRPTTTYTGSKMSESTNTIFYSYPAASVPTFRALSTVSTPVILPVAAAQNDTFGYKRYYPLSRL